VPPRSGAEARRLAFLLSGTEVSGEGADVLFVMALAKKVLIIDEDGGFRRLASHVLGGLGYEVHEAQSGRDGLNELRQWTPDCVLLDLELPDLSGLDVLASLGAEPAPRAPVVVVSANLSVADAVAAMKRGAADALAQPLPADRLGRVVAEAIAGSELALALETVPEAEAALALEETRSPALKAAIERLDRLASVEMPVLLVAGAGAGAAALARRLHDHGPRRGRPFVVVGAQPDPSASDGALFGTATRASAFAQARDGTLFIEALGELSAESQERLAGVLGELQHARASGQPLSVPRLVVAIDREPQKAVAEGRLRADLVTRLSTLTIHVPGLADRREDLPVLVPAVVREIASRLGRGRVAVGEDVIRALSERPWNGDLAELRGVLTRAVVLAREGRLRVEDVVGPRTRAPTPAASGWHPAREDASEVRRFEEYEAEIFRFALDKSGGCVSRAAELLGVGRATMYRKMRTYDIDPPPVSERAIARNGRRGRRDSGEDSDTSDPKAA
jgi:two-component system nitrogen regulation response regulator NtrX